MTYQDLFEFIIKQKSYLCVGLDTDASKIPPYLLEKEDALLHFNKEIVAQTAPYCVAYKINTAFYEALGVKGWELLAATLAIIPSTHFVIADAKRGDIGNTSDMYAQAFFKAMNFDAITVAPYMGEDSVKPFLQYKDKWTILLALTSNPSNADFQFLEYEGKKLFEKVIETSQKWADHTAMMYVVGATQANMLATIRKIAPLHFLLVPGVGAQGGSLEEVSKYGMNAYGGLLVNASRSILYASDKEDFALEAGLEAQKMQKEMAIYLEKYLNTLK